jgi:hypothetical protein
MLHCTEHDKDIRCYHSPGIAFAIVDKEVAGDVDVRPILEINIQSLDGVGQGLTLKVAFCHGKAVRIGVVNGRNLSIHMLRHTKYLNTIELM